MTDPTPERPAAMPADHDMALCWPAQWMIAYTDGSYRDGPFPTPVDAATIRDADGWSHNYSIRPYPWRTREAQQWSRTLPVWSDCAWWQNARLLHADHFVHVSPNDSTLLAYTQDETKGARNVQTPIKPGRYLTRFFSNILTAKEIAFYAAWQTTGIFKSEYDNAKAYPLSFATDADDIVRVYMTGPSSCMSHDFSQDNHPTRVYAAGDLAIAYLSAANVDTDDDTFKPIARALTWPARKVVGRIYPTEHCWSQDGFASREDAEAAATALLNHLMALGYKTTGSGASFNGARIAKEEADNGRYVMPYLDNHYGVDDAGDCWKMSSNPDHNCDSTDGTIEGEPEYTYTCEHCDEGQHDDDGSLVYTRVRDGRLRGEETWCEHCVSNDAFYCEGFQAAVSENADTSVDVGGRTYSEVYASENFTHSDFSDEWFDGLSVELENGETWSQDEFEEYGFTCAVTDERHPIEYRHATHPAIHRDCDDEQIAEWLGEVGDDAPITVSTTTSRPSVTIDDPNQPQLAIAA